MSPPGGDSAGGASGLLRHSGAEYGYLLSGRLVLTLDDDEYELCAGDAVSFESTTPHRYRNAGAVPATSVWLAIESSR